MSGAAVREGGFVNMNCLYLMVVHLIAVGCIGVRGHVNLSDVSLTGIAGHDATGRHASRGERDGFYTPPALPEMEVAERIEKHGRCAKQDSRDCECA